MKATITILFVIVRFRERSKESVSSRGCVHAKG